VNLIVVWRSVLGVRELIYVLVYKGKCSDYAENMRFYGPKLVALGDRSSGICAHLVSGMIF
jgi:hypothetical protein